MPELIINNVPYQYPDPGSEPGWGTDATGWAEAVTEVLNTLLAPGDILETSFAIQNNISSPTNITKLFFDSATVRAANIMYSVRRISTSNPSGFTESGTIYINYDNSASAGQKWSLSQQKNGDSQVSFSITDTGQLQYTSSDLGAAGYSGQMKFSAKTLAQ